MESTMYEKWVWQQKDWPNFHWQEPLIQPLLRTIRLKQGMLLGKTGALHREKNLESSLEALIENIIASSAIEGEQLNLQSVRSSLAKRLGLPQESSYPTTKRSEGLVKIMMDAIDNKEAMLSLERLKEWHLWLFPQESLLYSLKPGQLRGEEPMQVVSGRMDKPKVHYEAPPRNQLEQELDLFLTWFNQSLLDKTLDPFLRAAIAHFWFVTIHPFEDGNGRLTRSLTDLALAQEDKHSIRLYAMSPAILDNRKQYYQILEKSQRGTTDLTPWLQWFLSILEHSIQSAVDKIDNTLAKSRFWQIFQEVPLSKEQVKIVNLLFSEDFKEGISAAQYKKITKVSKATATRHLTDLLEKGCIEKLPGGGRSTRYQITR